MKMTITLSLAGAICLLLMSVESRGQEPGSGQPSNSSGQTQTDVCGPAQSGVPSEGDVANNKHLKWHACKHPEKAAEIQAKINAREKEAQQTGNAH